MNNTNKGILLAVVSSFLGATVILIGKTALSNGGLTPETFSFFWFGSAFIYCLIYLFIIGENKNFENILRKKWHVLTFAALLDAISGLFWLTGLKALNPAVATFLNTTTTIYILVFGILILKEKFNLIELIGAGLILIGTPIMTFALESSNKMPVIYILIACLLGAINIIIIKKFVAEIPPSIITTWRCFVICSVSFTYGNVWGNIYIPSLEPIIMVSLCSMLGPLAQMTCYYESLKRIEASKTALIRSSIPLLVLIGSWVILKDLPGLNKLIGGLILFAGVVILSIGKLKVPKSIAEILAPKI